jgi:hypothetical protein
MRRGSVSSAPVVGLRIVKRVCGALSGLELIMVVVLLEGKEGRVRVRVSVVGVKVRVVVLVKSGGLVG